MAPDTILERHERTSAPSELLELTRSVSLRRFAPVQTREERQHRSARAELQTLPGSGMRYTMPPPPGPPSSAVPSPTVRSGRPRKDALVADTRLEADDENPGLRREGVTQLGRHSCQRAGERTTS